MILDQDIERIKEYYQLGKRKNILYHRNDRIPCQSCDLFDGCSANTMISPKNCIYFDYW